MAMNVGEKRTAKYSGMEYEYECIADVNDASKKRYVLLKTGEDFETISDLAKRAKAYLDQKCVEAAQEYSAKQKAIADTQKTNADHNRKSHLFASAVVKLYSTFEKEASDMLFEHHSNASNFRQGVIQATGSWLSVDQFKRVEGNSWEQWVVSLESLNTLRQKLAADIDEAYKKYFGEEMSK